MKSICFLFFITVLRFSGFSQNQQDLTEQPRYSILIETISFEPGSYSDLFLELENKSIYSFKMPDSLAIPPGFSILVKDMLTGNDFILNSCEPHTFSVNRTMTKKFRIQMVPAAAPALASK